jgi:regulator of sigma E protease
MSFLLSIIPAAIVLGILIIIHEFGHFIACRLTGVKVEKFSIGFGPEILHWQGKETRFAISLFPLGGFVKPFGESVSEVDEAGGPKPGDYLAAPLWARMAIVVAGVFMNYVLALVLFAIIFMTGRPIPGTTIGQFVDGYPAKESGMQAGDRIAAINGHEISTWKHMMEQLEKAPDGALALTIDRQGQALDIQVTPKTEDLKDVFGKPIRLKRLGIMPDPKATQFEKFGVGESLKQSWDTVAFLTVSTHKAIFYLLMGKLSLKAISGPIGIVSMTGSAANLGLPYVMQLMATLSVSLAVINLLPVPALDGGHFLFLIIEAIRRKRVSLEVQERAAQVGFVMLLALMGFIIYNDLVNADVFGKIGGFFSQLRGPVGQ